MSLSKLLTPYVSLRPVFAMKIGAIEQSPADVVYEGGSWQLHPEDNQTWYIVVAHDFINANRPEVGDYYVEFPGGVKATMKASEFTLHYIVTEPVQQLPEVPNTALQKAGANGFTVLGTVNSPKELPPETAQLDPKSAFLLLKGQGADIYFLNDNKEWENGGELGLHAFKIPLDTRTQLQVAYIMLTTGTDAQKAEAGEFFQRLFNN